MAAAAIVTPPAQTIAAMSSLVAFLKAATDVCFFTWNAHHSDEFPQAEEASNEFSRLAQTVESTAFHLLEVLTGDAVTPEPLAVDKTCRVIAKDILIRLQRVRHAQSTQKDSVWDRDIFCETWSIDDVKALGLRLSQVVEKIEDSDSRTEYGTFPLFPFPVLGFTRTYIMMLTRFFKFDRTKTLLSSAPTHHY